MSVKITQIVSMRETTYAIYQITEQAEKMYKKVLALGLGENGQVYPLIFWKGNIVPAHEYPYEFIGLGQEKE